MLLKVFLSKVRNSKNVSFVKKFSWKRALTPSKLFIMFRLPRRSPSRFPRKCAGMVAAVEAAAVAAAGEAEFSAGWAIFLAKQSLMF